MFKKIKTIPHKNLNFVNDITICDSLFEETKIHYWTASSYLDGVSNFIIETYSNRKLNVAANIALYIKWDMEFYNFTLYDKYLMRCHKEKFEKYWDDVEKYLMLV